MSLEGSGTTSFDFVDPNDFTPNGGENGFGLPNEELNFSNTQGRTKSEGGQGNGRRTDQRIYRPKNSSLVDAPNTDEQQRQREEWSNRRLKQEEERKREVRDKQPRPPRNNPARNNSNRGNGIERPPSNRQRPREEGNRRNGRRNKGNETEQVDRSATLFSMWQSSTQQNPAQEGRREGRKKKANDILSKTPTLRDLNSLTFSPHAKFEENEIVLAPRTRGGFSYARVVKSSVEKSCYFDPHVEHNTLLWRVVYLNNGNQLFKDLPAVYVGKMSPQGEEEEEQNSADDGERVVGERPSRRDLDRVILSPQQTFNPDEIVLVPRSRGGFTYGKIVKEGRQLCPISGSSNEAHSLTGLRVAVSRPIMDSNIGEELGVIRKELVSACIGKITFVTSNEVVRPGQALTITFEEPPFMPHMGAKKESESIEELPRRRRRRGDDHDHDLGEETFSEQMDANDGLRATTPRQKEEEEKGDVTAVESAVQDMSITQPAVALPQVQLGNTPVPYNQIGGIISVDKDELLKRLFVPKNSQSRPKKHLIVLDGPNVAKKHGRDTDISSEGIQIALNYYNERGHDAICFLPQHYVKRKHQTTVTLAGYIPTATNIPMILSLVDKGTVILTPPQDYDDDYCIQYAMRYWDHVDKTDRTEKQKSRIKKWLREHLISFTFVRDEFLPNPNFKFPAFQEQGYQEKKQRRSFKENESSTPTTATEHSVIYNPLHLW
ncbi:hypothetical protein PROFUN_02086 [Planoprotostelium fungivorum]|uniref:RNase NYN domain-containing protein n=1 Tax=Planoprotostelium fungivorum TaxID=1890364 RepID=A0A2P6NBC0_9EUKA|nr:hypothetical protein PROFUN_02086 [Planoprotostelium fungivorum]